MSGEAGEELDTPAARIIKERKTDGVREANLVEPNPQPPGFWFLGHWQEGVRLPDEARHPDLSVSKHALKIEKERNLAFSHGFRKRVGL